MTTDKYREWDAAYVLGSLSPAERREYEQHLALCPDCAADVSALAGLSGPLAALPAEQAFELLETPTPDGATVPSLLPKLAERAERQRRRSRWRAAAAAVAAAAVAAAVALGAATWLGEGSPADLIAMEQQVPSPVTAEAKLVGTAWGTRIEGVCRYDDPGSWREPDSYALIVTNGYGDRERLSSWTAPSSADAWRFTANTSVPLKYVDKVEIVAVYPDKEVTLLATTP